MDNKIATAQYGCVSNEFPYTVGNGVVLFRGSECAEWRGNSEYIFNVVDYLNHAFQNGFNEGVKIGIDMERKMNCLPTFPDIKIEEGTIVADNNKLDDKWLQPPNPEWPINRKFYDGDFESGPNICPKCGSSLKRLFWPIFCLLWDKRSNKCVNEECENYYG